MMKHMETNVKSVDQPLSPEELKNPKSTISNSAPILKETKHYYIKLNEFEEFIKKLDNC